MGPFACDFAHQQRTWEDMHSGGTQESESGVADSCMKNTGETPHIGPRIGLVESLVDQEE
jgi:hypothetical protein